MIIKSVIKPQKPIESQVDDKIKELSQQVESLKNICLNIIKSLGLSEEGIAHGTVRVVKNENDQDMRGDRAELQAELSLLAKQKMELEEKNKVLNEEYNIPYHEYDLEFIFHTTIFMNDDKSLIKKGYDILKDEELPEEIFVNKCLIGTSEDGLSCTFKVIKEITIN